MTIWLTVSLIAGFLAAAMLGVISLVHSVRTRAQVYKLTMNSVFSTELSERLEPLDTQLAYLTSRLGKIEESKASHTNWVGQTEALNLNRRGQVIRMHRRGEEASEIASALRMSRGEVTLIIKVFEIAKDAPRFNSDENAAV